MTRLLLMVALLSRVVLVDADQTPARRQSFVPRRARRSPKAQSTTQANEGSAYVGVEQHGECQASSERRKAAFEKTVGAQGEEAAFCFRVLMIFGTNGGSHAGLWRL